MYKNLLNFFLKILFHNYIVFSFLYRIVYFFQLVFLNKQWRQLFIIVIPLFYEYKKCQQVFFIIFSSPEHEVLSELL